MSQKIIFVPGRPNLCYGRGICFSEDYFVP